MRTSKGLPVHIAEDLEKALELVDKLYEGPTKYARAVLRRWPKAWAAVAYVGGEAAGAEVYYAVTLARDACVHYYVVVEPKFRRRGVATALVRYVEQRCRNTIYMATTTEDNVAAVRLFTRLGYSVYRWGDLPRRIRENLLKATCGYDDDILLIKGASPADVGKELGEAGELWKETCLKPYLGVWSQ